MTAGATQGADTEGAACAALITCAAICVGSACGAPRTNGITGYLPILVLRQRGEKRRDRIGDYRRRRLRLEYLRRNLRRVVLRNAARKRDYRWCLPRRLRFPYCRCLPKPILRRDRDNSRDLACNNSGSTLRLKYMRLNLTRIGLGRAIDRRRDYTLPCYQGRRKRCLER